MMGEAFLVEKKAKSVGKPCCETKEISRVRGGIGNGLRGKKISRLGLEKGSVLLPRKERHFREKGGEKRSSSRIVLLISG